MLAKGKKFLVYTVKSGECFGSGSEDKTSTYIVKDPLSFEIWVFHNGQSDCDDDRRIVVTMIST